ncbi:Y-family DNA polymerase [Hyphomicrobium sp.]|jgi:DNA polymerase V|uniref:Y-family DNA polymerase n=1 Tax=Hyphomicrobium sp. TaxID=82 RepID=UPI0035688EBA
MFALIDANSFYCSCERAFDPRLRGKPVVALSNNDGCAIARTNEAKDLGIKMGAPWHLIKGQPELRHVIAKSSNYSLYADMSRRIYEVLIGFGEEVEPYSIDEMFIDTREVYDRDKFGCALRRRVLKVAKIPCCVGFGPTKTIAKLANRLAKADREGSGVCDLSDRSERDELYRSIPVGEVWGIGSAAVKKLEKIGVETVADFVALPESIVRELLTVTGLRTVSELKGLACLSLATQPGPKKSLAVTRSFGRAISRREDLEEAVIYYATRAAERLRGHGLIAGALQVFITTNPFSKTDRQYGNSITLGLEPSNDTFVVVGAARQALEALWCDGYRYAKAGIVLLDLEAQDSAAGSMFPSRDPAKSAVLMQALDGVNRRYGRLALRPGSLTNRPVWAMRRGNLSPSYTTRLSDILKARA